MRPPFSTQRVLLVRIRIGYGSCMNVREYAEPALWALEVWQVVLGLAMSVAFALTSGVPRLLRKQALLAESTLVSIGTILARTLFWFFVVYLIIGLTSGDLQRNLRLLMLSGS